MPRTAFANPIRSAAPGRAVATSAFFRGGRTPSCALVVDVRSPDLGPDGPSPGEKLRVHRDSEDAFEPVAAPNHARAHRLGWSDRGLIEAFEPMVSDARRD